MSYHCRTISGLGLSLRKFSITKITKYNWIVVHYWLLLMFWFHLEFLCKVWTQGASILSGDWSEYQNSQNINWNPLFRSLNYIFYSDNGGWGERKGNDINLVSIWDLLSYFLEILFYNTVNKMFLDVQWGFAPVNPCV